MASRRRRLLAPELPEAGGEVELDAEARAHVKVLRLEVGAPLTLFDGRGRQARARIVSLDRASVRCEVEPPVDVPTTSARVVLCQCLPKGKKLETIVRAATEIGVRGIHLVASSRSVPRLSEERALERTERLCRIAEEAARQSGSAHVPDLVAPAPLATVAARAPAGVHRLVFVPDGETDLSTALAEGPGVEEAWAVVGPEGGLSTAELAELSSLGFRTVRLFGTVLRVETAALLIAGLLRHALER